MSTSSYADVAFSFPFADHMVIQRGSTAVWGTAAPGEHVTLRFRSETRTVTADVEGTWRTDLKTGEAGGPFTLSAEGRTRTELQDILIGDVWLGSGQSNMHMALNDRRGGVLNAESEIAAATHPSIRLLQIDNGQDKTNPFFTNVWASCSPEAAEGFSAALYFFARRLNQELNVPIGVINASQGGSPIEPWLPPNGTLYEKCIAPLAPMRIKGVLWYQGETNARNDTAFRYGENLTALVTGWRAAWGQELPFYAVEITSCFDFVPNAHRVREQTIQALYAELQTGIISASDVGEFTNNHPKNKQAIGLRLANLALREQYGRADLPAYSPRFERMTIEEGRSKVYFQQAKDGLSTGDGEAPDWFQIAGEDRQFRWAKTRIVGNAVEVWHPDVDVPVAVQFAWASIAFHNLIGKTSALPAMPFRTHDWPDQPPLTDVIQLPVISAQRSHEALAQTLATSEPLILQSGGRAIAEIQIGVQGENLVIRAVVNDAEVTPNEANWDGASLEIYTASLDDPTVHQVVIPLTGGGAITSASCYQMGAEQPAINLPFAKVDVGSAQGYTLTASIPFAAFSLSPETRKFRMEASVSAAKTPNQKRDWYALFGSSGAFCKSDQFRIVTY